MTHLRLDIADNDRALKSTQRWHVVECLCPSMDWVQTHLGLHHDGALEGTQTGHDIAAHNSVFLFIKGLSRPTHLRVHTADHDRALGGTQTWHIECSCRFMDWVDTKHTNLMLDRDRALESTQTGHGISHIIECSDS